MNYPRWILAAFVAVLFATLTPFSLVLAAGPASVSDLAARLSPAVVNIGTSRMVSGGGMPFPDIPEGSPLNELFDDLNPNIGQGPDAMREARSLGSGFFISEDGLVVTNNHVIEGADEIFVYTPDNARFPAIVVGVDEKTDIAVLKVEAGYALPYVEFGDSDTAEVGDWVMVIGNPFGLGGSVSLGIVSARNRDINSGPYDDYIQTDAAINQGSSGGPIFDMDGKVVGVATAIIAQGGTSLGIGFAVPTNLAQRVVAQISEFGETRRGWLGVGIQQVTEDVALAVGQNDPAGALVVEVTPGGPSMDLLHEGDVIFSFNDVPIIDVNDLPKTVAQTPIGSDVTVGVWRNFERLHLDISLGQLEIGEQLIAQTRIANLTTEADGPEVLDDGVRLDEAVRARLGFSALPITRDVRRGLGLPVHVSGLIVDFVEQGSQADLKGLHPGMVLGQFERTDLTDVGQLQTLAEKAEKDERPAILLKIFDQFGIARFIALRLD